ncbi:MAG: hypothetical protein WCE36_04740 [Pseudolabrys sp.]
MLDVAAGSAKTTSNVKVDPAPSFSILICPAGISPSATPFTLASRASGSAPSAKQVAPFAKERVRRWPRFDEFAVGREHGGGAGDVRQQTVCSVWQGDLAPSAFGGHDQYCRGVVRERDARAQTYQHTTERRTEAA